MERSKEDEEILAFLHSEQDAYYRGDFEAFIAHWHHGPEVRRMISGPSAGTRVHQGWDELVAKFEEGFRQYPQDFDAKALLRWENVQIVRSGDMAWITLDQIAPTSVPGLHAPPLGHETKIIKRYDGEWKLVGMIIIVPDLGGEDSPRIELSEKGEVVSLSALAEARLADHQGLVVAHGRLRARQRACDAALQAALGVSLDRLATNLPRGFRALETASVFLGEDDQGQAMFCWVINEQERVVVTFDDAYLLRKDLEKGAARFGLSPGQVDLVVLLAQGRDLAAAAEELGVSAATTRTQIRRAFEKTGVHSQTALISLLMQVHRSG